MANDDESELDFTLSKYLEAITVNLDKGKGNKQTIWFKPLINAPLGYTMFLGSNMRNIEIVSKQDYLTS